MKKNEYDLELAELRERLDRHPSPPPRAHVLETVLESVRAAVRWQRRIRRARTAGGGVGIAAMLVFVVWAFQGDESIDPTNLGNETTQFLVQSVDFAAQFNEPYETRLNGLAAEIERINSFVAGDETAANGVEAVIGTWWGDVEELFGQAGTAGNML